LGGFAIRARVALLWQHNANPGYKLASIPRYDDIVRTAGWAESARTARHIWEVGVAGSPVIGRRRGVFSTLLRQSGLRATTGGVLATKSECKMLASTCLYSLYAWFSLLCRFVRRPPFWLPQLPISGFSLNGRLSHSSKTETRLQFFFKNQPKLTDSVNSGTIATMLCTVYCAVTIL